jgi:hypothetical protein
MGPARVAARPSTRSSRPASCGSAMFRFRHMDYVTRQFINLTKKFRKEIRPLLSRVSDSLDKHTKAVNESAKAAQQHECPAPEVTVINKIPDSIEVHQNAKETSDERNYRRFMFLLSGLSLAGLVVYAYLVFGQYTEMIRTTKAAQDSANAAAKAADAAKKSADTSADALRLDQRSWMNIKFGTWKSDPNGPIRVDWFVVNSGKVPIRHWSGFAKVEVIHIGHAPQFGMTPDVAKFSGGILFPNEPPSGAFGFQTTKVNPQTHKVEPRNPSPDEVSDIEQGRAYVAIHGELRYSDVSGHHWLRFCTYRRINDAAFLAIQDAVQPCMDYNNYGDSDH